MKLELPSLIHRGYYMAAREIRNLSSSVEKYFTSERSERVKYFSIRKDKFRISNRPCNVISIYYINTNEIPGELYYAAKVRFIM